MKAIVNSTTVKNKNTIYISIASILVFFVLLFLVFDLANNQKEERANIVSGDYKFLMNINGEKGTTLEVLPTESDKVNISVTSLSKKDLKYKLSYQICKDKTCKEFIKNPMDLKVEYSSKTQDGAEGTINHLGNINVTVITLNTSKSNYYVKFNLKAGDNMAISEIDNLIKDKYDEQDFMLTSFIDGEVMNEFPTTSNYLTRVVCKKNNSGTTASGNLAWNGSSWTLSVEGASESNTRCNAYFVTPYDNSGANPPNLATNMIPVTYDINTDTWVKADENNTGGTWFSYTERRWANAVTVRSDYRDIYVRATVGTAIPMDRILGFFVWIPRYEYNRIGISSFAGGTQAQPGMIAIKFISGTSTNHSTNYTIHPSFRNGTVYKYTDDYDLGGWDKELSGFWIGKFQTSSEVSHPQDDPLENDTIVKPDSHPVKFPNANQMHTISFNLQPYHGIGSEVESHLTKTDEWAATAYLSVSIYGKSGNPSFSGADKEVYINNVYYMDENYNFFNTTGRSAGTYDDGTVVVANETGAYEYNDCPAVAIEKTPCELSARQANAGLGTGASTTGNIYGVYDMNGAALEVNASNNKENPLLSSKKYYNIHTSNTISEGCNGTACIGQCVGETDGWFGANSYFDPNTYSLFILGGAANYLSNTYTGLFSEANDGINNIEAYGRGFRTSLS